MMNIVHTSLLFYFIFQITTNAYYITSTSVGRQHIRLVAKRNPFLDAVISPFENAIDKTQNDFQKAKKNTIDTINDVKSFPSKVSATVEDVISTPKRVNEQIVKKKFTATTVLKIHKLFHSGAKPKR